LIHRSVNWAKIGGESGCFFEYSTTVPSFLPRCRGRGVFDLAKTHYRTGQFTPVTVLKNNIPIYAINQVAKSTKSAWSRDRDKSVNDASSFNEAIEYVRMLARDNHLARIPPFNMKRQKIKEKKLKNVFASALYSRVTRAPLERGLLWCCASKQ
jgi:hypothetical protein